MVEKDINDLRDTLKRALAFAMDASGIRAQYISLRKEQAAFYGIGTGWANAQNQLRREAHELLVEIAAVAPAVWAIFPDLKEPLADTEAAIKSLLFAIVNVELDEPALVLWEQELDRTIKGIEDAKSGQQDSLACTICGVTFLQDFHFLNIHFSQSHARPQPSEMRLISPEDQRVVIETAVATFRGVYEETLHRLTDLLYAPTDVEVATNSAGGTPAHPWRDIMIEKALEWQSLGTIRSSRSQEAAKLLEWGISSKLPLVSRPKRPSPRTVETWLTRKPSKKP